MIAKFSEVSVLFLPFESVFLLCFLRGDVNDKL